MSKRSFQLIIASIVGFLFVLGDAFFLCAQETATEEFTLEEITVTAQKREENQQKVAIAMDVIMGEKLLESGKTNVDDILANISNVLVNNAADGMRVSVRGLTESELPEHDMHTSTPMVAINIDGAYNSASSAGQNLFDVERVEVLYGPQSTLYSSNSPGGVVNVVTVAPKTDKYSVNASAEYGSYNLYNLNFAGNAPIVKDMLAMRLAGQLYKRDDFVTGDTADNTKSARLKTLFQPNDRFSTTITGTYARRINGGMLMGNVKPFDYQDGYWYTSRVAGPGQPTVWEKDGKVTNPWTTASTEAGMGGIGGPPGGRVMSGPNQGVQITKGITGEINLDTGIGNLSIVPQYSKTTSDDNTNYTSSTDNLEYMVFTEMRSNQKGVEGRMTSAEDFIFKWILGVNYYRSENARYTTSTEERIIDSWMKMTQKNKAFFGNITYPFTDKVRGIGGYRMSWTEGSNAGTNPEGGGDTHRSSEYPKHPDYRLGVEYDAADNSMLYFTYATSYRANPMGMMPMTEDTTEKLTAYTAGSKNRFFGNKLQVNVAAYYYDYKNKTANLTSDGRLGRDTTVNEADLADPDGNPVDINNNDIPGEDVEVAGLMDPWAGQQIAGFRTIGVDLSSEWVITSKDRLSLSVSYLNAEWKDIVYNFYYKNADGSNFWESDGKNFGGYTNTFSPTWTITSSYEHVFTLGSYGNLVPHIDLQYKSSYFLDYVNRIVTYQESYYTANGSFTFTHSSGMWSLNGYVKNATNYASKNFFVSMGTSSLGISDPRTYGAVLSIRY